MRFGRVHGGRGEQGVRDVTLTGAHQGLLLKSLVAVFFRSLRPNWVDLADGARPPVPVSQKPGE